MEDPERARLIDELSEDAWEEDRFKFKICGTDEGAACWCQTNDMPGLICSGIVFAFLGYATAVIVYVVIEGTVDIYNGAIILFLIFMGLWSHLRTMLSDPGMVPINAHPLPKYRVPGKSPAYCQNCEGYKPPFSHHDKNSDKCISRMDHFCPWMNNAIGAKNQKNFFLFLIYTDLAALYAYILVAIHLIDCKATNCVQFTGVSLNLVRAFLFILLFAIIFTSSMVLNQIYGLVTGLGTIDRMKLKHGDEGNGTPIPFNHVFGDWWPAYFIPLDPYFKNPEDVFLYEVKKEKYTKEAYTPMKK